MSLKVGILKLGSRASGRCGSAVAPTVAAVAAVLVAAAMGSGVAAATGATEVPARWVGSCAVVAAPTPDEHTRCAGADLRGADLAHTDLRWADLSGADVRGANFTGSDLSYANLSDAALDEAVFTESQRRTVTLIHREFDFLGVVVGDFSITTDDTLGVIPASPPAPNDGL
ncbi:Pentapeptide repeat-containing protein [Rhodococcus triatomae]|uniref:Pentapeptide repeat-containing protein n=1 Tax=Rhodococcus triatomae TaxID=300028 RepID=A0A1G8KBX8_9NOCA|nr:Pentapeptide repeat-containing protein [Rhodococcus triatomae]